jgi:hypothetical protein
VLVIAVVLLGFVVPTSAAAAELQLGSLGAGVSGVVQPFEGGGVGQTFKVGVSAYVAELHAYDSISTRARDTGEHPASDHEVSATSAARELPAGPRPLAEIGPGGNPGSLNTVIGKVDDLTAPGAIRPGERSLLSRLPDQGSPRANYAQNSSILRQEMRRGVPIRDATVDPLTGELANNTGFLRLERDILQHHEWWFDSKTGLWMPPSG